MNKYIRLFNNHTDYETYLNSEDFVTPSVAHCILENDVHYNPMPDPIFNGYDYVDLDLPSGTLWARANVGALNETESGLFFAWGETTGYSYDDIDRELVKSFDEEHYKYCTVSLSDDVTYTKYVTDGNSSNFDNLVSLELTDDAASVNMGGAWHTPTYLLYVELYENTIQCFITPLGDCIRDVDGEETTMFSVGNKLPVGIIHFKNSETNLESAFLNNEYLFFPILGIFEGRIYSDSDLAIWSNTKDAFYDDSVAVAGSFLNVLNVYRSRGVTVRGVVENSVYILYINTYPVPQEGLLETLWNQMMLCTENWSEGSIISFDLDLTIQLSQPINVSEVTLSAGFLSNEIYEEDNSINVTSSDNGLTWHGIITVNDKIHIIRLLYVENGITKVLETCVSNTIK